MEIQNSVSKRESAKDYIPLTENDLAEMLKELGETSLDGLFKHIDKSCIQGSTRLPGGLSASDTTKLISSIGAKNKKFKTSFLGDSLARWKVEPIADAVAEIRGLSTAYTPYQPERSQGTLVSHWLYECTMASLTGFEAVNCSLYDRATAIFEAATCAARLTKKNTAVLCRTLADSDIEVAKTLAAHTKINIELADGIFDVKKILSENADVACVVFPQVTNLGTLEDVDALADLCSQSGVKAVAAIDPMLLGDGGLKPPSQFGGKGADIISGEGQHLCSRPNFGGPGLGVFAVRFNGTAKNDVRQAPGRFVGKAKDLAGRDAFVMVLSAREQHIRREKATSNICSNQAFMATLAGASLLQKGDAGMRAALQAARASAELAFEKITAIAGFEYPFGETPFFNEFCIKVPCCAAEMLSAAAEAGIELGLDVSSRAGVRHMLKFSFTDASSASDIAELVNFLKKYASGETRSRKAPKIPHALLRKDPPQIPQFGFAELKSCYEKLGELNVSPDDACYPLGSCTMKYNPLLTDELANLESFSLVHPQARAEDSQGCLEILWRFAESVKALTNLDDVALQPVAGAQGELCALKMFQAYHADHSRLLRDVILIPASAHGTNFASAAVAGFEAENIIHLPASVDGKTDMQFLSDTIEKYGSRIAAIMVTNPNTSGIFETEFKRISDAVRKVGGLVYMDGANFNAVAGRIDLKAMGVDAVHNNIHKTWAVSHGGGGPGDGFVAVDAKLADYIPSYRVINKNGVFSVENPKKSIGSLHRNFGNFAHKIRALAYISRLGGEGVRRMSGTAVLSARWLLKKLSAEWDSLPARAASEPRMHEFILTPREDCFAALEGAGVAKASVPARIGKLFLDFGFHAPTVSFPEPLGMMIEPTESYGLPELARFAEAVLAIGRLAKEYPQAAAASPRFTPVDRIDEVEANRKPVLSERILSLPKLPDNRLLPKTLAKTEIKKIFKMIAFQEEIPH